MISLVTQSDGSARRFPFVSLALAIAMGLTFSSLREQTAKAQSQADATMADAIEYFEEHPSLVLPESMNRFIAAERVAELQAADEEARAKSRNYGTPRSVQRRMQNKLDEYVALAFAKLDELPRRAFALTGEGDAPARYFDHVLHHASVEALALSLFALLLFGIALEDAWGSMVFGVFCAGMVPASAVVFLQFPPLMANPWIGGAGLSVALLGATAARWFTSGSPRLLGGFPLAPWLWIPAWFAADVLLVRQLDHTTLDWAPVVVYATMLGSGFCLALMIRGLGLEEKLTDRWDDSKTPVKNPTYEKAMDLRAADKREEAMELLVSEFSRKASVDLALGIWDVSKEVGRPEDGMTGALHLVRDALRRKDEPAAMTYWCELTEMVQTVDAEPPLFVKIAELLGAAGKHDGAVLAIDCATRAPRPLPPGLSLRAAKFVAARDADLASRVAARAIDGGTCTRKEKTALEAFLVVASDAQTPAGPSRDDEMPAERRTPGGEPLLFERRELPAFKGLRAKPASAAPLETRADESASPAADPSSPMGQTAVDFGDAYENLDPGALDPNALGGEADLDDGLGEEAAAEPSEIESWNSPGMLGDLSEPTPETDFGAVDLASVDADATRAELFGGVDDEPLAASIEEQMEVEAAQMLGAADDPVLPPSPLDPDESTDPFQANDRETCPIFDGDTQGAVAAPIEFRTLRAIEAVPLALEPAAIKVDADGKGKTRLPYERIDAISVGAVRGLSDRPVVIIDLVLNLRGDPSEPLRVLRIRSDRFDPRSMVEGAANGVEALKQFVAAIEAGSRADLLPNADAVHGEPFAMFDSLNGYEREVLNADGEASA